MSLSLNQVDFYGYLPRGRVSLAFNCVVLYVYDIGGGPCLGSAVDSAVVLYTPVETVC